MLHSSSEYWEKKKKALKCLRAQLGRYGRVSRGGIRASKCPDDCNNHFAEYYLVDGYDCSHCFGGYTSEPLYSTALHPHLPDSGGGVQHPLSVSDIRQEHLGRRMCSYPELSLRGRPAPLQFLLAHCRLYLGLCCVSSQVHTWFCSYNTVLPQDNLPTCLRGHHPGVGHYGSHVHRWLLLRSADLLWDCSCRTQIDTQPQ